MYKFAQTKSLEMLPSMRIIYPSNSGCIAIDVIRDGAENFNDFFDLTK